MRSENLCRQADRQTDRQTHTHTHTHTHTGQLPQPSVNTAVISMYMYVHRDGICRAQSKETRIVIF